MGKRMRIENGKVDPFEDAPVKFRDVRVVQKGDVFKVTCLSTGTISCIRKNPNETFEKVIS